MSSLLEVFLGLLIFPVSLHLLPVITALPCMWSIRNVTTYPTIPRDTQNLNRIQHQNASVQAEPHAPVTVLR
jgi:hypothetical protein